MHKISNELPLLSLVTGLTGLTGLEDGSSIFMDLFSNTVSDRTVAEVIESDIKGGIMGGIMGMYESRSIELKEVVAFANTNGGTLYIGVRDNGEGNDAGHKLAKIKQWVSGTQTGETKFPSL